MLKTHTFEIFPTGWNGSQTDNLPFQPMLMDIPVLSDSSQDSDASSLNENRAARRAWWQAFHLLGSQGIEPEGFTVYEYSESQGRGRLVTSGGFVTL